MPSSVVSTLIPDASSGIGVSEVPAHGLRDPVIRGKIASDYVLAREGTLEIAGLKGRDDDRAEKLTALAGLIVAVIDGLSLQVAADPDGLDRDLAFRILADMGRDWLASRLET